MLNLNLRVMIFCSLVTKLMVSRNICTTLENQVKIPMNNKTRSFNLVSSVSIGASEALRQLNV